MAARDIVQAAAGSSSVATYIEDVFSTWLYDGNGSSQTINNGIDLSGKGGMVWIKSRPRTTDPHIITDTARGATKYLSSNATTGETTDAQTLTSFNSNGFTLGTNGSVNQGGANITPYASWTFRKQPKFFDIVTYTGNGVNQTIAHNLGSVPGCIIVKRTDTTRDWQVYHRSLANTEYLVLNTTAGKATGTTRWNSTTPTDTVFSLGTDATVNANGGTYVAYLFAHDAGGFGASGSDNVISCGLITASPQTITLGYEPQFVITKGLDSAGPAWEIYDNMRGIVHAGTLTDKALFANTTTVETGRTSLELNANGFTYTGANYASPGVIYIAIRRPMKTPTSGTEVFTPFVYTGTNVDNRLVNAGQFTDMAWVRQRDSTTVAGMVVGDRMRGQPYLLTGSTNAELDDADSFDTQLYSTTEYGNAWSSMTGFWVGNDATSQLNASTTASNQIAECFKRAPGFFDVVCYTGDAAATRNITHNLGVVPQLIITKNRTGTAWDWAVYQAPTYGTTGFDCLKLNTTGAANQTNSILYPSAPTASYYTIADFVLNDSGKPYVSYLFGNCPGVSKVGSYTGNGSSQTINCGFTSGARFVLIKRTDNTGDWYVWDTARGIVAANDPRISLNQTSAEATGDDSIDADNTGFIVNQNATTNINVNTATYIYLAIA